MWHLVTDCMSTLPSNFHLQWNSNLCMSWSAAWDDNSSCQSYSFLVELKMRAEKQERNKEKLNKLRKSRHGWGTLNWIFFFSSHRNLKLFLMHWKALPSPLWLLRRIWKRLNWIQCHQSEEWRPWQGKFAISIVKRIFYSWRNFYF